MHIAFLLSAFHSASGGGGAESYVSTMADALIERGHRVSIIALGDSASSDGDLHLVKVAAPNLHWFVYRALPLGKSLAMPVREIEWSRSGWSALTKLHQRDPVDVVETGETMVLQQTVQGAKPPVVIRAHGNPLAIKRFSGVSITWGDRLGRKLQLMGMRRANAITAVSKFQAKEIAADLLPRSEAVDVIYNPISPLLLRQAVQRSRTPTDKPVVLYTGRIEFRKGTLDLLRSVDKVASVSSNVEYVVSGSRHNSIDDSQLEAALPRHRRNRVRFTGHIPWQELPDLYRCATVFVMPSYYETFGISVIEAMAFGLPVVATTAGGLPEVVEDGITGLLVPPGDADALADGLMRLLRDPDLRERMGRAGQERVRAEFTVDRIVPKTLAVYESVIGARTEVRVSQELTRSCAS